MLQTTMTSLKAKKNSKKGFTLMEMLIVVAIIAILVAVSIPMFTSQLTKAKQATDDARCQSCCCHNVHDRCQRRNFNSSCKG